MPNSQFCTRAGHTKAWANGTGWILYIYYTYIYEYKPPYMKNHKTQKERKKRKKRERKKKKRGQKEKRDTRKTLSCPRIAKMISR